MASKVQKDNYIVIQGWMIEDLKLKGNELIIYAIIYGFSQTEGQLFNGSLQYLADWTNSTKQGVSKNLKSLIEKSYIVKNDKIMNGVKFCEYYATKFNRGMQQSLIPPIQQSLTNNIDINNKIYIEQIEAEFEKLWKEYPNKKGKDSALNVYKKARKEGTTFEEVQQGIINYNKEISIKKTDKKYIKHGSTWFNQKCWNDDYETKEVKTDNQMREIEEGRFKL